MWPRYILFIALSLGLVGLNAYLMRQFGPEPAAPKPAQVAEAPEAKPNEDPKPDAEAKPAEKPAEKTAVAAAKTKPAEEPAAAQPEEPESWWTLGSADPSGAYRLLVTLTTRGAAVNRIEMSTARLHQPDNRNGWLGGVVMDQALNGVGALVQVVGEGTPAMAAGIVVGDVIQSVNGRPVSGYATLRAALEDTKPGQTVEVVVRRQNQSVTLPVTLGWQPMEVVGADYGAPPSFLMAFSQIDNLKPEAAAPEADAKAEEIEREIPGANLRTAAWEVVSKDQNHIKFRRRLPQNDLVVYKTFRLEPVPQESLADETYPGYHLTYDIEIENTGSAARQVVYQIEGPNGLPKDGWWYASKVGRTWTGGAGLRDAVMYSSDYKVSPSAAVAKGDLGPYPVKAPVQFFGVDAQYFAAMLIPQRGDSEEIWYSQWSPVRYGAFDEQFPQLANISVRVESVAREIKAGESLKEQYLVFAGPKRPDLLEHYGLSEVVYYGWFGWVARSLLVVLHGIHSVIPNYGIAIILLTVLVRLAMFPLSRKQAMNMQKMSELQPEIKRIQEKHKNNMEARGRAQQELFRKHNYNPAGGCLVMFIQLPIFIGLYRALMVDVELYQAPLLSETIRWASNLAAPDMLFDWSAWMPMFVQGWLGPFFNVFPIVAVGMFLWQQKMFMPPPTDEQQALQQKMMQYMMIFMGVLFFKVASGLCLYFIASSLWGVAERKFLPKAAKPASGESPPEKPASRPLAPRPNNGRDGSSPQKKKSPRR